MKITTAGLDTAKNVFHFVGINEHGREVKRKKLRRKELLPFLAKLEACVIVIEACGASHHWGREIQALGHEVKMLPPRAVKGYLQGNKNDFNDAAALAEAGSRERFRSIKVKSLEQQDLQSEARYRQMLTDQRTQLVNHSRGLLAEYGMTLSKGITQYRKRLPELLEDAENGLTGKFRRLLSAQYDKFLEISNELSEIEKRLSQEALTNESVKKLIQIPGIGVITATELVGKIGNGQAFRCGRELAAFFGLVPRQHSSADKQVLLGISKRGDRRLRSLLVHGARSVLIHAPKKTDKLSRWICELIARRGKNKATVALANKLARIAWRVLRHNEDFDASLAVA